MKTRSGAAALCALAFLGAHLPFLPVALEDLDSINFALGLRAFDVAQHQPHPPGYPVFVFLGRFANGVLSSEVMALSALSVVAGSLAVLGIAALLRRLSSESHDGWRATVGMAFSVTAPLFWVTAARPLSDMSGLASTLAAQVLTLRASTPTGLAAAAFVAAAAVGVRTQVVPLTVPLLLFVWWGMRERRLHAAVLAAVAYGAGVLVWAVPLLVLSGGIAGYLRALGSQGTEDFAGVAMLATQPTPRLLLSASYSTWVAPWGAWWMGAVMLSTAAVGVGRLWRTERRTLGVLCVLFGPYALFHLVFQETATTRYALPLVLPIAYLAAAGLPLAATRARDVAAVVVCAASLAIGVTTLKAYAGTPAPAFRVLEDMRQAATGLSVPPALAMHRRQELDMRRPLVWNGARVPAWSTHLPAPPKHEWLELVKYWNAGGRAPVWLLADPPRSDLRLIDPRSLTLRGSYRWPFDVTDLVGGIRPNVMDWYEVGLPNWYVGEGWALTPESAGLAKDEGRGPGRAPIQGWVRRHTGSATLMIGGRNFGGAPVPFAVSLDGRDVLETTAAPGFFLHMVRLEAGALLGDGDVAALSVRAGTDELAVEQFDIQTVEDVVYGFAEGWHEQEYNPRTGRLWRWTSDRSTIRVRSPHRPLILHLDGEFETSASTAQVVVRSGDRLVAERDVERRFKWDIAIPADVMPADGEMLLTIETDQWYVPAETNWRPTQDRRRLGLRLFAVELRPAS